MKPDDIPQDVWDKAVAIFGKHENPYTDIASAIIAERKDFASKVDVILDTSVSKVADKIFDAITEREACATLADQHAQVLRGNFDRSSAIAVEGLAAAIRNRNP